MIYFLTVNYYSSNLITQLHQSIKSQNSLDYLLVIVNNSPNDQEIYQLSTQEIKILDSETNLGFGKACNLGLNWIYENNPQALVWLINPDTYLLPNTLEKAEQLFTNHPQLSIVGTLIYTPNHQLWFAGGKFNPTLGNISSSTILLADVNIPYIICDWVSGCSFLLNLGQFSSSPQFDPAYFLYYEDFDFCRRYTNQGYQIFITYQVAVIHQPSSITNRYLADKLKYSTYSYLLTLKRYSNLPVFGLRFLRLILSALALFLMKPQAAIGKLKGMLMFIHKYGFK